MSPYRRRKEEENPSRVGVQSLECSFTKSISSFMKLFRHDMFLPHVLHHSELIPKSIHRTSGIQGKEE